MSSYSQETSEMSNLYVSLQSKNIKNLLKQLRIKSLALDKANQLIKMLSKQLKGLHKLSQERLKQVEQALRQQYHHKIDILKRQNHQLKGQITRLAQQIDYDKIDDKFKFMQLKTKRQQRISQQNIKEQNIFQQTGKRLYQPFINIHQNMSIKDSFDSFKYQDLMLNLTQLRQGIIDEINDMINEELQKLDDEIVIVDVQCFFDDLRLLEMLLIAKEKRVEKRIVEMQSLLQSQRMIIQNMKEHIQKVSQLFDIFLMKLNTRCQQQTIKIADISEQMIEIKMALDRQKMKKQHRLQLQNNQLKQIINQMIDLFKKTNASNLYL